MHQGCLLWRTSLQQWGKPSRKKTILLEAMASEFVNLIYIIQIHTPVIHHDRKLN